MSKRVEIKMIEKVRLFVPFLLVVLILSSIPQSSASFEVQIITHPVYTVYVNQSYVLTVDVQYDIPPQTIKYLDPIEFWISSPQYESEKVQLEDEGVHSFELQLVAPDQHGDHTIEIKLHVNSKQHNATIMDVATISYKVAQLILNDWAIMQVWITPESPVPGDEVTLHATVTLKNTTYGEFIALHVARAAFYLNDNFFSGTFLRFDPALPTPIMQETQTHQIWIAEEGQYRLRVVVADNNHFPDPFPNDDSMEMTFSIDSFYDNQTSIMPEPVDEQSIFKPISDFFGWIIKFFKELFG